MKKRYIALGIAGLMIAGIGTAAYVASPTVHEGQSGELPELAVTGPYAIGTEVREHSFVDRASFDGTGALTGKVEVGERTLQVRYWYPSTHDAPGSITYGHTIEPIGQDAVPVASTGFAHADGPPVKDQKFPLVIMSHGFGGWPTQFSKLAEHIASRGYVVASIDHAELERTGVASFLVSFGNVLLDRTLDQRQLIDQIIANAQAGADPVSSIIDPEQIGLIGYSMGGYGALATAGAAYDFTKDPMASLPQEAKDRLIAATKEAAPIDALVAFAPWGGQPDNRAWTGEELAGITAPTFIIAGNQDDVVNFKDGVSWIYDSLTGSDRNMLVFREARHNVVGDPFTLTPDDSFQAHEFLMEPVWRSERLNAINQHFVAAFLDLHLKGDTQKAAFLEVPTSDSNDSEWPVSFGDQLNGKLAGAEQDRHWRGFQRRWAVGLEMRNDTSANREPAQ